MPGSDADTLGIGRNSNISSKREEEDIEEGKIRYRKGGFHPVRLGEVYNAKYKVLRKLGYGRYSTVWLVRNQE
jgi:serine/threonine-protein kinase SRPK3